jgi:hypothetical protein
MVLVGLVAAGLTALALGGCSQLLGDPFDEDASSKFAAESGANHCGGVPPLTAEPLLPFVPAEEFEDSCTSCVADACSERADACLADAACRAILTCRAGCKDPACQACCGSFTRFGRDLSTDLNAPPAAEESLLFRSHELCVSSCRIKCGAGLNWECVGKPTYRWPSERRGTELRVQLELRVQGSFASLPAEVEAYSENDVPLARGQTGGWGKIELDLTHRSAFRGYFLITPQAAGYAKTIVYPGVLARNSRGNALIAPIDEEARYTPDAGRATAIFGAVDCLGYPAIGVRFELDGLASETWYAGLDVKLQRNAVATGESGVGGVLPLEPQESPVAVVATYDGRPIAHTTFLLRSGYVSEVGLFPLSIGGQ